MRHATALSHKRTQKEGAPESNFKGRKPMHEPRLGRKTLKVLVLDDCQDVLLLYGDLLRHERVEILASKAVNSVDEAMALVRLIKPDIVISDLCLTMGHTEGFEILAKMREEMPFVPVALSSCSYPNDENIVPEIEKKGFDALFNKGDVKGISEFISRF